MTPQDNMNKVLAGLTAVNNRDIEGFMRLLEPDFKLYLILKPEALLPQGRISGPEGFGTYLSMLYTAFADVVFQQESLQASGKMVHQQILVLGQHKGPLVLPTGVTIPPTGRKIHLPVEVFHTFNDQGGFIGSTGYANLLDILKQFKS